MAPQSSGGDRNELELAGKGEWQRDLANLERATAAELYDRAEGATTVELRRKYVIAAELHTEAADLCDRLAVVFDRLDALG